MATPKPGEIRCPTCHRSTPPAAFCTQCGSAIPSDARARPRGMDRDELQDRIRARRSGGDPYRRGVADAADTGYERYEPEPEDTQAKRAGSTAEPRQDAFQDARPVPPLVPPVEVPPDATSESIVPPMEPRWPDVTRETDDWGEPRADDTAAAAAAAATTAGATGGAYAVPPPPPSDVPVADAADESAYVDNFDDDYNADYPYAYDWEEPRQRRSSGAGAFAILGFLALGVLALMGGAVLAGVFSGDPNTGAADPTLSPSPTLEASVAPSVAASVAPSVAASGAASASPAASGEPVVFPDGFTAETQPCIPGSADLEGCDSNGTSNSGTVWVWVGFENGTDDDVLAAIVAGPDSDTVVGEGTIPLERIGCAPTCPGGWTYFPFSNLSPGTYEVTVERNGETAATTTFTVE